MVYYCLIFICYFVRLFVFAVEWTLTLLMKTMISIFMSISTVCISIRPNDNNNMADEHLISIYYGDRKSNWTGYSRNNAVKVVHLITPDLPAAPQSAQFPFPGFSKSLFTRSRFFIWSDVMVWRTLLGCLLSRLKSSNSQASKVKLAAGRADLNLERQLTEN